LELCFQRNDEEAEDGFRILSEKEDKTEEEVSNDFLAEILFEEK
jgi:hypothetical protein